MAVIQRNNTGMMPLYVIGAGGFGREVLSWLRDCPEWERDCQFAGFIDDNLHALERKNTKASVVAKLSDFLPTVPSVAVCAIGDPATRLRVCRDLSNRGMKFFTLIHPTATVGDNTVIGTGCIICPGAVLTANVRLGNFVIVNALSTIGHDAEIGDGVTLSGHVDITGNARIAEGVFLGTHAAVLPGANVGAYAKVGAGSVVLRTVKPGITVMGVPAKQISP
jgi:sugar O-acyltransferase (sialic acid O-acetyltransferase NeuD family)